LLHRHFPAIADEFMLATASEEHFSGQVLVIRVLNAKMAVLSQARKGLGP
jgi:hypothetical protein